MSLASLISALNDGVPADADARTVAGLMADAQAHASAAELRKWFADLLRDESEKGDRGVNVLSAGVFGVLPGGRSLLPTIDDKLQLRVNPFLHRLRLAILARPVPPAAREANARLYPFYPEFVTAHPTDLRSRISAVARAHAGMGSGSPELTALYSLGGFFDAVVAGGWPNVVGKPGGKPGGTTCMMTARAVYHAAGAQMIGARRPVINTPGSSESALGVPREVVRGSMKAGKWVPDVGVVATVERADKGKNGVGYDEDGTAPPQLRTGDIYLIRGDDEYQYLMRGGGAVADHVGIVVHRIGDRTYHTVDGGTGGGAEVKLNERRTLAQVSGAGWTFTDADKSYSAGDVDTLKLYGLWASNPADIERQIKTDRTYIDIYQNYDAAQKKLAAAVNPSQRKAGETALAVLRNQAVMRSQQGVVARMKLGKIKTIQGWWSPEPYGQLAAADRATVRGLLGAG